MSTKSKSAKSTKKPAGKRVAISTPSISFKKKDAKNYPGNSWVAFNSTNSSSSVGARVYEGVLTRDKVRAAYRRDTKVAHINIRARRVSNFS